MSMRMRVSFLLKNTETHIRVSRLSLRNDGHKNQQQCSDRKQHQSHHALPVSARFLLNYLFDGGKERHLITKRQI